MKMEGFYNNPSHAEETDMEECERTKGVWIPRTLWMDHSLTPTELVLLNEICSYDIGGGVEIYSSSPYLTKRLHITPKALTKSLQHLFDLKWIDLRRLGPGHWFVIHKVVRQ